MSEEYTEKDIERAKKEGYELGLAQRRIDDVTRQIDDMSWVHDDPTGQDADRPEYQQLFADRIAAQDAKLQLEDPDAYAEQKYFEACAARFP